jgi:hypothetical protein
MSTRTLLQVRYPLRTIRAADLHRAYVAFEGAACIVLPWDVFETCTKAMAAVLMSGTAIVKDLISVGQVGNATSGGVEWFRQQYLMIGM